VPTTVPVVSHKPLSLLESVPVKSTTCFAMKISLSSPRAAVSGASLGRDWSPAVLNRRTNADRTGGLGLYGRPAFAFAAVSVGGIARFGCGKKKPLKRLFEVGSIRGKRAPWGQELPCQITAMVERTRLCAARFPLPKVELSDRRPNAVQVI
jgi:hypothetical protein